MKRIVNASDRTVCARAYKVYEWQLVWPGYGSRAVMQRGQYDALVQYPSRNAVYCNAEHMPVQLAPVPWIAVYDSSIPYALAVWRNDV